MLYLDETRVVTVVDIERMNQALYMPDCTLTKTMASSESENSFWLGPGVPSPCRLRNGKALQVISKNNGKLAKVRKAALH